VTYVLLLLFLVLLLALPIAWWSGRRSAAAEARGVQAAQPVPGQPLTQEQQYAALAPVVRTRFDRLRQLCDRIQANYRALSPESQGMLADQEAKFDVLLAASLQRLWLIQKYDEMIGPLSEPQTRREIGKLKESLAAPGLEPRTREALEKNLAIKEQILQTVRQNVARRAALLAELDSHESLLQLLLQKSVAATDASGFSIQVDEVLAQAEADAASVEEMERFVASLPDPTGGPRLSDKLKQR
jgi:DNA repair exonuclease SbcCD ATPase subunit